ncbi:MAG: acylneuraminate cytidylyltransferase [Bacteroidetes bacterium]|nr:acylneuraminate cytidylyltransferase [Bacteroidota bacterium]
MITAFIPARCGSKSIKLKNIKSFCGKPLIFWNLQELENVETVNEVIVATDCDEIEKTILNFNFSKVRVYRRDENNARDESSTESVMLEYLTNHKVANPYFMLVQATSPLTTRNDFNDAVKFFKTMKADSLISCVRIKRFFWNEDGTPLNYDYRSRPRRQEFKGVLTENGAFYINHTENILKERNRISGKICCYEMPEYAYVEIDEENDWIVAEKLMLKYFPYIATNPIAKKPIKLVATDVDGVLTDAGMYYSENGDELKKFNTRDGKGFELLRNNKIITVILTSENTEIVKRRGAKIKADHVIQNVSGIQKLEALIKICEQEGLTIDECAYIGDDINCIEILNKVGYGFCPSDAEEEVKKVFGITILNAKGGSGVFRELVNQLKYS